MQNTVPGLTYAAMLDASPVPTSVIDAAGTVVYLNDAFLAYAKKAWEIEIRREDRIGRNVRQFITGGSQYNRERWLAIYDSVLQEGSAVFLPETHFQVSSDREMYVDVLMNPIKGEEGKVVAAVLTWQDVTDRVKARREETRKAALDRVRAKVFSMRRPEDMDDVLTAIFRELRGIGVTFNDCSILTPC